MQKKKVLESYDSVKMLSLMSKISSTEDQLYSINREIDSIQMDEATHDITSLSKIGKEYKRSFSLTSC